MMHPPCPRSGALGPQFLRDEDHEGDFVPTTRIGADGTSLSSKASAKVAMTESGASQSSAPPARQPHISGGIIR